MRSMSMSMRVNCVDNSKKVSYNTQRSMRRNNMRFNCVDNSNSSSLKAIELVLLKRIQLLGEKKYFLNRFRKSLLSLPHNLKVLFSSAAVNLFCVFKVVARSIYKALIITKDTTFIKFLFYLFMLITSVICVLISVNSSSIDDFALNTFEHDVFQSQLSVSKPVDLLYFFSQGSYAYSKPVDLYNNDAWRNKSELYFFSQGSYAYSMTYAHLSSHGCSKFRLFFSALSVLLAHQILRHRITIIKIIA